MPSESMPFQRGRRDGAPVVLASILVAMALQQVDASPAFTVSNPDWDIAVTEFGYADLLLDRRPGFDGREFLSGEWAAAVCFTKGGTTHGPIWLEPEFIFPDWESNSDFGVETRFNIADPSKQQNEDGFPVWSSTITNDCLRITLTYEMLDTESGIEMGVVPRSQGGVGDSLTSSRYVFRQTYTVENISGQPITDLKLFQFLHGLETDTAVYDDRSYGGPLADYRFDSTQWGTSFSIHKLTGAIVLNHDWISFMSDEVPPSAWDTGYYGRQGADSHWVGKPGVGLHLRIESNDLQDGDFFHPAEGRWVSGAQRYNLGDLANGAEATKDVVLTIQTHYDVKFESFNVQVRDRMLTSSNTFRIEFEEVSGEPVTTPQGGPLGFALWKAAELGPFDPDCFGPDCLWERVQIPYGYDPRKPEVMWFDPEVDPDAPQYFFLIQPSINATPPPAP